MTENEERENRQEDSELDEDQILVNCKHLADVLLTHHSSYHDHKENMAHAVFLVELVLFGGAVFSPSNLVSGLSAYPYPHIDLLIIVTLLWLLAHTALRWQLRAQRWAAMQYAGVLRTFARWAERPPSRADLEMVTLKRESHSIRARLLTILDSVVWPCQSASCDSDLDDHAYPKDLVECVQQQYDGRPYPFHYETLLTAGSILLWIAVVYSVLKVN